MEKQEAVRRPGADRESSALMVLFLGSFLEVVKRISRTRLKTHIVA